MVESPPAQESTQPSESTQPQHDMRNDEAAGDESASLLPSDNGSPPAGLSVPKATYVLTILALSFSASTLVFLIATQIALAAGPYNFQMGWQIQDGMKATIAPAIFSLLISAYNLARLQRNLTAAPLLINIILDILVAIFAIAYGASGLAGTDASYCYYYGSVDDSCSRRALPARIFAGIALGSAVLFGTVHLALFVVRCIVAYRSKFWKGPWMFPDGQLTVELSLKLFKEPQKPREVGADAV